MHRRCLYTSVFSLTFQSYSHDIVFKHTRPSGPGLLLIQPVWRYELKTRCVTQFHNIPILNSVRQHNHFLTQGNYKATCFDYRLVILRPIWSIVPQDAMHTLGSHRAYIHGIHQIKSFVSKGVTCKLCLQEWDT